MRTAFKMTAGTAVLALAGGVAAACGSTPPPSARDHLEGDGYALSRTIPHDEIAQEYSVGSMLSPAWTTDGATGTRGNSTEQVYKLTPQGEKALRDPNTRQVLIGNTGYGDVGLEVHLDPGFLTISGPTDEMQPSAGPNVPVPAEPSASAPAPSGQYTGDPQQDVAVWAYGKGGVRGAQGGMKALPNDPGQWSAVQILQIRGDLKAAATLPLPTSVDPEAHYSAFLAHIEQYVRALENGYTAGAVTERSGAIDAYQGIQAEFQADGLTASGGAGMVG